jgi:acetyl esterase/lipase
MKYKVLLQSVFAFVLLCAMTAGIDEPQEILLWPNGAPGSEGKTAPQKTRFSDQGDIVISSVNKPSIRPYLPDANKATGVAVIVAPGGGHSELWISHEGYSPAKWLRDHGIAAFVLKYRLARDTNSTYTVDKDEVADIQRAIRLVRSRAKEWGIDTARIGVMGFSAGGELAALAAMRYTAKDATAKDPIDRESDKPDFQGLIYPGNIHRLTVSAASPPAFIAGGYKDRKDISEGTAELYLKYKEANVPAELHIYGNVGHGFGIRASNTGANTHWPEEFAVWLSDMGFISNK